MSEENQYPSLIDQGKNLAEFSFELVKRAMQSEALFVSDKIQNERMKICKSCEKYDETQNRCIECGCWLNQKTKFALDSCPLKKWDISNEDWINGKYDQLLQDRECCNKKNS